MSVNDIETATNKLNSSKRKGADGIHPLFYKSCSASFYCLFTSCLIFQSIRLRFPTYGSTLTNFQCINLVRMLTENITNQFLFFPLLVSYLKVFNYFPHLKMSIYYYYFIKLTLVTLIPVHYDYRNWLDVYLRHEYSLWFRSIGLVTEKLGLQLPVKPVSKRPQNVSIQGVTPK